MRGIHFLLINTANEYGTIPNKSEQFRTTETTHVE